MQQNKSVLYFFLSLTRGSWRNAFYLECRVCPYGKDKCGGYLLTADTEGAPVIFPVTYFEKITGEKVDKNECAAVITKEAFESLFNRWLLWNISKPKNCSVLQISVKPDSYPYCVLNP